MTRDELLAVPVAQLVNLIIEYQLNIAHLQARVAELESRLSAEEESEGTFTHATTAPVVPS